MWSLLAKWETPVSAGFQILHTGKGNMLDWRELVLSFSGMKWQIIIEGGEKAVSRSENQDKQLMFNMTEQGEQAASPGVQRGETVSTLSGLHWHQKSWLPFVRAEANPLSYEEA